MDNNKFSCPNCHYEIELTDALTKDIRENITKELEEKHQASYDELNGKLSIAQKKQAAAEKKERELRHKEREIDVKIEEGVTSKLSEALENQKIKMEKGIREELKGELREREKELEARKSEIDDLKHEADIEKQKAIRKERAKWQQKIIDDNENKQNEHDLKIAEKNKVIERLKGQISDMEQTANSSSQELQGEVWEDSVENFLRANFPSDTIEPIKKGMTGADTIQIVLSRETHRPAGKIIWEMKNTKHFSNEWIPKLKDNQRSENADIAVLATIALPEEIESFGFIDGVCVCSPAYLKPITIMLRNHIIEIDRQTTTQSGREDKITRLYNYINSDSFRNHVEIILEKYSALHEELEREKRSTKQRWARQAKNIDMMQTAIADMFGGMKAIAGNTMGNISHASNLLSHENEENE